MKFHEVCAILCNEPFSLKPWEIARLTPFQVRRLYLCERDREGRIVTGEVKPLPTSEEMFYRHWKYHGLRQDQIDRLWEWQKVREAELAEEEKRSA